MADRGKQNPTSHHNQPYDESLDVPDSDEVTSVYTPTPRVSGFGKGAVFACFCLFQLKFHQNQPFDESIDLAADEIASIKSVSPVPKLKGGTDSGGNTPPDSRMNEMSDDDVELERPQAKPKMAPAGGNGKGMYKQDDNEETDGSTDGDEDDDDDEDENSHGAIEGSYYAKGRLSHLRQLPVDNPLTGFLAKLGYTNAYDPNDYEHLAVSPEIKELFQYITRYTPQTIDLEHCLKPFIPEYIPAVGDIDAFIKVPRPDGKDDKLGLFVLDEPCAKQSDPIVLEMLIRSKSKQSHGKTMVVKAIDKAEKNPKAIENWCQSISDIHRTRPPPTVHYTRNMPDMDTLMQEWPPQVEELLKEVSLPSADMDCDLKSYIDMICGLLDIPVYKNRVQSLHVLFTLYSQFKNSQHFRSLATDNKLDNALKDDEERLVL